MLGLRLTSQARSCTLADAVRGNVSQVEVERKPGRGARRLDAALGASSPGAKE